ncbi:hypothetical protein G6F57_016854 [Rhizopus arrhizus]|nr:hypothetical protein G6F57_016854 [Rhizopus arrhizus]
MPRPIWRSRSDPAPDCACAPAAAVRANAPVSTALLTPFMEPPSTRGVASGSSCPHACIASVQPVTSAPPAPRAVVAARLRQARVLRGLSQREVGVRMGMDKDAASARISRYESEGMSISLEALFELAQALEVPPAYLLATSPAMADAILALGEQSAAQQERFAELLGALGELPSKKRNALIEQVLSPTKD